MPASLVVVEETAIDAERKDRSEGAARGERRRADGRRRRENGPRTPLEELLVEMWEEVLGVTGIGIEDNFFELGGHSLLATQVVARARDVFQVDVPLRTMFEAPSIVGLGEEIEQLIKGGREGEDAGAGRAEAEREQSRYRMRSSGCGLSTNWRPEGAFYNVSGAVKLEGEVDEGALGKALREVVRRHESLRTRFKSEQGEAEQEIGDGREIELRGGEAGRNGGEEREREAERDRGGGRRKPFDLRQGPLLRMSLVRLGEQEDCAGGGDASHRVGWMVIGSVDPGDIGVVWGVCGGRRVAAGGVAGAVCGLHVDGRGNGWQGRCWRNS